MPHPFSGKSRMAALGAALATLVATPSAFAATATPPQAATPVTAATAANPARAVTLITGDTVTVSTAADGSEIKNVRGPDGRVTGFHVNESAGDTYVYPDSALPYVAAGLLDKDLFNLTELIADGYDNAHTDQLPLIVTYTDAATRSRTQAVPAGATRVRALSSIQGAALIQKRDHAADFWSALTGGDSARRTGTRPGFTGGVEKIWLDGKVTVDLADSTAQVGAPEVWAAGNTGTGVEVAVLDTGVDTDHPDLAGQISDTASFVPEEDVIDRQGHGTHVASTIAGTGAASDGKEKGVAPGARLLVGKVLANDGNGQESWVLAGMEWAAREKRAKIVSMSLGTEPTDGTDPLSQAVNALSAETGALFTIAAGNSGPHTVSAPGTADAALTVGAVDGSDQLADFSSTGPRLGDYGLKPEITAPGVDVLAARSQYAVEGEGHYQLMSGTSMATPHVAGTAALLAAAHPGWTGTQLKDALVSSTKPTPHYSPYDAGSGRLDAAAVLRNTVFASAGAYSGFHPWPQEPGEKVTKKVTYTNTGDSPVTLDLAVNVPDAPEGLFTLSAAQVTVPAHGNGTVSVIADLDRAPLETYYSGTIDASTDGKLVAHTLVGVSKEGERYNLSLTAKDRGGKPISGRAIIVGKKIFAPIQLDETGAGAIELPAGTYTAWAEVDVEGAHGPHSMGQAILSVADIKLDRDRDIALDGSAARQVQAVTPQQTTTSEVRMEIYRGFGPTDYTWSSLLPQPEYDSVWTLPTGKVTEGEFSFGTRWRKEEPALTVSSGSRDFDDLLVQRGATPLPEGKSRLDTVFAGRGSAADFANVRTKGKAAVVRRDDTVPVEEQAAAAAAAGARLLLIVNDGYGRLQPWWDNPYGSPDPAPLTVATLTHEGGEQLIAQTQRGRTQLTVVSSPTTDYLYDLVHHYEGAIPEDLTYRPRKDQLARVDVSFRNHQAGRALECRLDAWQGFALGNPLLSPALGERTDRVSADQDTAWIEQAQIVGEVSQQSPPTRYAARSTTDLHWFGPIHRPRVGVQSSLPARQDDTIGAYVPGWSDSGSDHSGSTFGNPLVKNRLALYQGDTLLADSTLDQVYVSGLSPQRLPYRLVSENSRGDWQNPYSTRTRTEWGFTSTAGEPGVATALPLIQLDYRIDTDTAGKARRNTELAIIPTHVPGGPSSTTINAVKLDISYDDGATWRTTSLTRAKGGWTTRLHAPVHANYVTLRTAAHDREGNSVTQNITRAFGLK